MIFDDLTRDGKPQARALAPRLGGEKRIEDIWQYIRRNARAAVTYRQLQAELALALALASGQSHRAILGRYIQRVTYQVEQRGLNFRQADRHLGQGGAG